MRVNRVVQGIKMRCTQTRRSDWEFLNGLGAVANAYGQASELQHFLFHYV